MNTKPIVKQLSTFLGAYGFVRQKVTWNRRAGELVDVLDIQVSKAGNAMTVNTGVLDPSAYATCWGTEPPIFVEEPRCTVRARIGQLIDGEDHWWHEGSDAIASEITASVQSYVLPFLERMHTKGAMAEYLTNIEAAKQKYPPPIIYLAVLKWKNNDAIGARNLLDELYERCNGEWKEKVRKAAERLTRGEPHKPIKVR